MGRTDDTCIYSKCAKEAFDEGLCKEHLENKEKVGDASKGDHELVCIVCQCSPEEAKPHFNKKHKQCQKHLTNAHYRKKAAEKKAAKGEPSILLCANGACSDEALPRDTFCAKCLNMSAKIKPIEELPPQKKCIIPVCDKERITSRYCEGHLRLNPSPECYASPLGEPESTDLRLDLTDYPEVFKNIKDLAKDQIRSIPHQVIFILRDYFEVAEGLLKDKCQAPGCPGVKYINDHCQEHQNICLTEYCQTRIDIDEKHCSKHSARGAS